MYTWGGWWRTHQTTTKKDRTGRKSGYFCRTHQSTLIWQLWGGHKGNTAPTGLIKEWVALHYLLITLSPPREPVWSQTQAQAPPPLRTHRPTHTHLWSLTGTKESTQEVPMVHNLIKREKQPPKKAIGQALFFFLSSPAISRVEEGLLLQAQVKGWCTMIRDWLTSSHRAQGEPVRRLSDLNQNRARRVPTRLLWTAKKKKKDKRIRIPTTMQNF